MSPTDRRGPIRVYKNRDAGSPKKAPRCLCCFPQSRAGQIVPLGYGVEIVLCEDHRDPAFVASYSGRAFYASVLTTWRSMGLTGRRYEQALLRFVTEAGRRGVPAGRPRPGSYTWPHLRRRGEEVWAAGGTYHDGEQAIVDALGSDRPPDWPMPSPHTIRRWWREKRWLFGTAQPNVAGRVRTSVHAAARRFVSVADHRAVERSPITLSDWWARGRRPGAPRAARSSAVPSG